MISIKFSAYNQEVTNSWNAHFVRKVCENNFVKSYLDDFIKPPQNLCV